MNILVDILNTLHLKFDSESQTTLFNVLELMNAIIPQPYMQERFFGLSQENRKPTASNFETVTKLLNDCSDPEISLSGIEFLRKTIISQPIAKIVIKEFPDLLPKLIQD